MSYKAGIVTAITELKDRTGSSSIAIKKHMQANLPKDKKWMNATYLAALKKMVADGDLVQNKASYKLSAEFKKKASKSSKKKRMKRKRRQAASKNSLMMLDDGGNGGGDVKGNDGDAKNSNASPSREHSTDKSPYQSAHFESSKKNKKQKKKKKQSNTLSENNNSTEDEKGNVGVAANNINSVKEQSFTCGIAFDAWRDAIASPSTTELNPLPKGDGGCEQNVSARKQQLPCKLADLVSPLVSAKKKKNKKRKKQTSTLSDNNSTEDANARVAASNSTTVEGAIDAGRREVLGSPSKSKNMSPVTTNNNAKNGESSQAKQAAAVEGSSPKKKKQLQCKEDTIQSSPNMLNPPDTELNQSPKKKRKKKKKRSSTQQIEGIFFYDCSREVFPLVLLAL